jgi:protein-arginine kinase activator protein McsA
MKGRPMILESIIDKEVDARRSEIKSEKCTLCNQTFKSSADLVRSGKDRLCMSCYQSLLDPFPRLCCDGAAF